MSDPIVQESEVKRSEPSSARPAEARDGSPGRPSQVDDSVGREDDGATTPPEGPLEALGKAISAPILETAAEDEREQALDRLRATESPSRPDGTMPRR